MRFGNREKLSNEERFGKDVAHSQRRLTELRQLHESLRQLCQSAAEAGQRVAVNGRIEIKLFPDRTPQASPSA